MCCLKASVVSVRLAAGYALHFHERRWQTPLYFSPDVPVWGFIKVTFGHGCNVSEPFRDNIVIRTVRDRSVFVDEHCEEQAERLCTYGVMVFCCVCAAVFSDDCALITHDYGG